MRLRVSAASAKERLIRLVNEGYATFQDVQEDFQAKRTAHTFDDNSDSNEYAKRRDDWANRVLKELAAIFPTQLEAFTFANPRINLGIAQSDIYNYVTQRERFLAFIRGLDQIRRISVDEYTDLPLAKRLYVEDIDSFQKVRDVNPASVTDLLEGGYLDRSEDSVQMAIEQILAVPMHKKDWGGETNDLYTANVLINGARHETAFVLKGNGLKKKTMEIRDCGTNGDQILRLVDSPAKLFVVQFVGNVSEAVIKDLAGKIEQLRSLGREAWYLVIDGQDTARLLRAYGKA